MEEPQGSPVVDLAKVKAWLEAARDKQHAALLAELNQIALGLFVDLQQVRIHTQFPTTFEYVNRRFEAFCVGCTARRSRPVLMREWENITLNGVDAVLNAVWTLYSLRH